MDGYVDRYWLLTKLMFYHDVSRRNGCMYWKTNKWKVTPPIFRGAISGIGHIRYPRRLVNNWWGSAHNAPSTWADIVCVHRLLGHWSKLWYLSQDDIWCLAGQSRGLNHTVMDFYLNITLIRFCQIDCCGCSENNLPIDIALSSLCR